MNITEENCMELILKKFPGFQSAWDSYKAAWSGETTTIWGEMFEFSSYVSDLLIDEKSNPALIGEIFSYIEYLLANGNENVQNAACTCFLENILNITPTKINPGRFVPFLGPESRKYCKGWDEFTGVQTEGL